MPRSRSTAIQSERTRRRSPRALTSPANWIAPPNSSNFSVKVVLPASGCEMIANVRRRKISSVRVVILVSETPRRKLLKTKSKQLSLRAQRSNLVPLMLSHRDCFLATLIAMTTRLDTRNFCIGVLINPFQLFPECSLFRRAHPRAYTSGGYDGSRPFCQRLPPRPSSPLPRHLFCLFYQVEIRYRQLPPERTPARSWAPTCAEVRCDYGNRMIDQHSAGTDRCPSLKSQSAKSWRGVSSRFKASLSSRSSPPPRRRRCRARARPPSNPSAPAAARLAPSPRPPAGSPCLLAEVARQLGFDSTPPSSRSNATIPRPRLLVQPAVRFGFNKEREHIALRRRF